MNALRPKPLIRVLIMTEKSRLSREQIKTAYTFLQFTDTGMPVWFYLTDEERKLKSTMNKIMGRSSGTGSAADVRHMLHKAKAGHVIGGRVFGYDNYEIVGGDGSRSHVELGINETEAAIVRPIFRLYAGGHGFTSMRRAAAAPAPRPESSKPYGSVSSSVRQILLRRLYVGKQVWGRTKKGTSSGVKRQRRPDTDWIFVKVPQLKIVLRELWQEAKARWKPVQQIVSAFDRWDSAWSPRPTATNPRIS